MLIANPLAQTQQILNPKPPHAGKTGTMGPAAAAEPGLAAPPGWPAEPEPLIRKLVLEPQIVRSEIAVLRAADDMYGALLEAVRPTDPR